MRRRQHRIREIGSEFTPEGIAKLKTGMLLRFNYENSIIEFIITKLNRKSGKVFVKDVTTYHPDQVNIKDKNGNDMAFSEKE